jgi:processive 1,2-diacylglycerol beta-glucosyltransferase
MRRWAERLVGALLDLRHSAQVVVICGRRPGLKERLDALAAVQQGDGRVALRVVGYTRAMDEYMAAADLLVGKPGGLTTAEALARGLPLVIVNPIPGQEERNADHLLEEGAAIRCNNLPVLADKIERLLADPARLAAMRASVGRLARPRAAHDVVASLLEAGS